MREPLLSLICLLSTGIICTAQMKETVPICSPQELAEQFVEYQNRFLPVAPPDGDIYLHSNQSVLSVDFGSFPKQFIKKLEPQQDFRTGHITYPLYVFEDALSREIVFLNASSKEIARIPRPKTYDPFSWATSQFGALTETQIALYDPARLAAEYTLIDSTAYADYTETLSAQSALEASAMPMMMAMSSVLAEPQITTRMTVNTNGLVELNINLPDTFTGKHIEIFSKDNLVYSPWQVSKGWLPIHGNTNVNWSDPGSAGRDSCFYFISDADADSDGDGYSDVREVMVEGTSSNVFNFINTDNDEMLDPYEYRYFGDLSQSGTDDFDGDGLKNSEEMIIQAIFPNINVIILSDPTLVDTDGDGMNDYLETVTYPFLDPNDPDDAGYDYDSDGLNNLAEHNSGTALDYWDTDGDTLSDKFEVQWGTDPLVVNDLNSDIDGDGLTLGVEHNHGSNPFSADTDEDGFGDYFESITYPFLDPNDPSDGDFDHDGLANFEEHHRGTDLKNWDTDGDTLPDGIEVELGTNPLFPDNLDYDADGDGLTLVQEYNNGTSPYNPDSDGDGISDGTEVSQGSSPTNESDGGNAPAQSDMVTITLSVGDPSGSASEVYEMTLSGERTARLHSGTYGNVVTGSFTLKKGCSYTASISHVGSKLSVPDYDYTATVSGTDIVKEDPGDILGTYHTSGDDFHADGKTATVHIPKVTLNLPKTTMTLKHDNQSSLQVTAEPAGLDFSGLETQIRFADAPPWRLLGAGANMNWTTKIAGNFELRGCASANGQTFYSEYKTATVQFPSRSQILADPGIVAAMNAEWQQTLIDSTPTQQRERGFIVYLDTTVTPNVYLADDYGQSQWVSPGANIFWMWNALIEPSPFANAAGAKYPVGRFHTHPPEEYAPLDYERDTGPLLEDEPTAFDEKTPGFVYDYKVGVVFGGYAETNSAKIYGYGPERKNTP